MARVKAELETDIPVEVPGREGRLGDVEHWAPGVVERSGRADWET